MAAGTDKLSEEDLKTISLKVIEEGDKLMPTLAEQCLTIKSGWSNFSAKRSCLIDRGIL